MNIDKLRGKIDPKLVKKREASGGQTLSYVPGYAIESTLNEVAEYVWSRRTLETTKLFCREYKNSNGKDMIEVAFSARVEITIPHDGHDIVKQGCGFGNGQSSITNPSAAYELAIKEAETDAFKRAAKSLGERFGLELYDKDLDVVRSYETAKRTDDTYNAALAAILSCDDEKEIAKLVKGYNGNYKNDIRESAISHIATIRSNTKGGAQ